MIFLILFLLLGGIASADVYVMTDSNNAVVGLSEQNDMVVPAGNKIATVKGNIANLPISGDPLMYNFSNGAFSLNTSKVQAKQAAEQAAIAVQTAKEAAKASGVAKLKALGLTDDEIGNLKI